MYYKLDIGSGGNPNPDCNVFLDRFLGDTYHRHYKHIKIMENMVQGDALFLPFKTNSIEYVHSRDVIEHLDNPLKFIEECKRVSSNIDIYTNTVFSEIHALLYYGQANEGHKWAYDQTHKSFINIFELRKNVPPFTTGQKLFIKLIKLLPRKIRCKIIDPYFFIMDAYLKRINIGFYSSYIKIEK